MKKVLVLILLISILSLCLVACNNKVIESIQDEDVAVLKTKVFCGGDYDDLLTEDDVATEDIGYVTQCKNHKTQALYNDLLSFINTHKIVNVTFETESEEKIEYLDLSHLYTFVNVDTYYTDKNGKEKTCYYVYWVKGSVSNIITLTNNVTVTFLYYE